MTMADPTLPVRVTSAAMPLFSREVGTALQFVFDGERVGVFTDAAG